MPQQAIAETLAIWREAERLLDTLPVDHPQRKVIQFELVEARAVYRRLTDRQAESREAIDASIATLRNAWETVKSAMDRIPDEG